MTTSVRTKIFHKKCNEELLPKLCDIGLEKYSYTFDGKGRVCGFQAEDDEKEINLAYKKLKDYLKERNEENLIDYIYRLPAEKKPKIKVKNPERQKVYFKSWYELNKEKVKRMAREKFQKDQEKLYQLGIRKKPYVGRVTYNQAPLTTC